jgi:SNF2 family DNA or RNA helicase
MALDIDLDPWDWTVKDVQTFFQHKAANYIDHIPHGTLPSLDTFLNALTEESVDGYTLLHEVDAQTLKADLGVTALRSRSAVLGCVRKLRIQSAKYAAETSQPFQAATSTPTIPQASATPIREHPRPKEIEVQDSEGRKRRKLDLTGGSTAESLKVTATNATNSVKTSTTPVKAHAYLSDKSFSVDKLFFGGSSFGQEIDDIDADENIFVSQSARATGSGDDNFQFCATDQRSGDRAVVGSRMRHFLANAEYVSLQRNEHPAIACLPYREDDIKTSRSAIVVQIRGKRAVAIKEDVLGLANPINPNDLDNGLEIDPGNAEEWDYLMEKYCNSDDEVLPVFGEWLGDEENNELEGAVSSIEDEDAESMAEEDDEATDLSQDEAAATIDKFVSNLVDHWHAQFPKLEQKRAWTVWNKMKRSRIMQQRLIASARGQIEHLTKRLDKMKSELLVSHWANETSLQKACVALEVTVEDREEQRWKISVWQRRREPAHTIKHGSGKHATGTPSGPAHAGPTFVPHPEDRISSSPPLIPADDEPAPPEEEVSYEADDEQFHTPESTPAASPEVIMEPVDAMDDFMLDSNHSTPGGFRLETDLQSDVATPKTPAKSKGKDRSNSGKESSYTPGSRTSNSSDDLPSASELLKQRVTSRQSPLQSPTKPASTPKQPTAFVDLSNISSSASNTPKKRGRPSNNAKGLGTAPTNATASDVASWSFDELVKNKDRQRALIMMLRHIGPDMRKKLSFFIKSTTVPKFIEMLIESCRAFRQDPAAPLHASPATSDILKQARAVFFRWFWLSSSEEEIANRSEPWFRSILDAVQARIFTQSVLLYAEKTSLYPDIPAASRKIGSSTAPVVISSSDERISGDRQAQPPASRKVRKNAVKRSETAQKSRQLAAERQERYNQSQTTDPTQLAAMVGNDHAHTLIDINPARDEEGLPIYVHGRIARKMKPHQIDGVRFLWREITANGEGGGQGCILAHTMGLGKTMQTITLLVALNEAAHSSDKHIRLQLPEHLRPEDIQGRNLRVLIICPPSLSLNWSREIHQWAHDQLGEIYTIESAGKAMHLSKLEEWDKYGGVLLIGYDMFRIKVKGAPGKGKELTAEEEKTASLVRRILLDGAEVVVADEAHHLKNDRTGVSKTAAKLKTESRIGLTGTPMSNDVQEIYALISFVAPGFLGEPDEFKADYAEPIKDGLYHDSTYYEKRKSLMKLKVLHAEIQPKVNRANIEVLRGSLKPKVEFVINVPLGNEQTELYRRTVTALLRADKNEEASQVTIFGWLAVLTLLTNHPKCFHRRLTELPKPRRGRKTLVDISGGDQTEDDGTTTPPESERATPVSTAIQNPKEGSPSDDNEDEKPLGALGLSDDLIKSILEGYEGLSADPTLSAKVDVFVDLVERSLQCGDKILVFSSSIFTLDFLSEMLSQSPDRFGGYRRIDGRTSMPNRTRFLKEFHERKDVRIMLVSTRAGGVGLNIQGANRVFIFDFGFNPTHEEQAIGRAYRLGQTKPVFVYRFVAGGTFETNIYNKQLFKTSLAQRVVDKMNPRRNAERNTREYLYEPKEVTQEPLAQWSGKDPQVLDKLLAEYERGGREVKIRAIKTMETLQEDAMDAPLDEEEQRLVNAEIASGKTRPRGRRSGVGLPAATQQPVSNNPLQPGPSTAAIRPPSTAGNGRTSHIVSLNVPGMDSINLGGLPMPKK